MPLTSHPILIWLPFSDKLWDFSHLVFAYLHWLSVFSLWLTDQLSIFRKHVLISRLYQTHTLVLLGPYHSHVHWQNVKIVIETKELHGYLEENGLAAMLATKRLAGVTPEVNLRTRGDITQNRGINDSIEKDLRPPIFLKKRRHTPHIQNWSFIPPPKCSDHITDV